MMKELQRVQEKLRAIDNLTNCMQKLNSKQSKEVAYLIHRIVGSDYVDITLAREIIGWKIISNKELFINVQL